MFVPNIPGTPTLPSRHNNRRINIDRATDKPKQQGERRRRPDRRRKQIALSIPDRRKRKDRRQPKLLNYRSARPEKISSQKGRTIDTKV